MAKKDLGWHDGYYECNGLASAANDYLVSILTGLSSKGATKLTAFGMIFSGGLLTEYGFT